MKVKDSSYFMLEYLFPSKHLYADSFSGTVMLKDLYPCDCLAVSSCECTTFAIHLQLAYLNWRNYCELDLLCWRKSVQVQPVL